jgi:hypothetical protein
MSDFFSPFDGVTRSAGIGAYRAHPFDKEVSVDVIPEDQALLYATNHYVVKNAGGIETGMARHVRCYHVPDNRPIVIYLFTVVPFALPIFD